MFFRSLTEEEKGEFREWARKNYKPGGEISLAWHPAVQEECVCINQSAFVDRECAPTPVLSLVRREA